MRYSRLVLASGMLMLWACSGGEPSHVDSTSNVDTVAMPAPMPAPPGSSVAAAPITGQIHEVKLIGDAQGYRFEPANITARVGDGIRFVVISLPPHNVAFDPATIPAGSREQLFANMSNSTDGTSDMLIAENDTLLLSLGNLPLGNYPFHCTPHLAMGMKGEITLIP
jgi:plastocyanin